MLTPNSIFPTALINLSDLETFPLPVSVFYPSPIESPFFEAMFFVLSGLVLQSSVRL